VAYNGPGHRSPYRYLQSCLQAGIDFEVIGLQLYYPDHDLFEIDRCLDRFASLGKPIHITEMATSSQPTEGNSSMQIAAGSWRGPWSEALQADWLEAIYTLAYSKPAVEAISWWDLCDRDTFWPFGGLLDAHCQPKLAFQRLLSLQTAWGIGAAKAEKIAKNRP
jgi:GH35 family endo-1,4-beta-xylanase